MTCGTGRSCSHLKPDTLFASARGEFPSGRQGQHLRLIRRRVQDLSMPDAKNAVLPVPDWDWAIISLPATMGSIARCWMAEGTLEAVGVDAPQQVFIGGRGPRSSRRLLIAAPLLVSAGVCGEFAHSAGPACAAVGRPGVRAVACLRLCMDAGVLPVARGHTGPSMAFFFV